MCAERGFMDKFQPHSQSKNPDISMSSTTASIEEFHLQGYKHCVVLLTFAVLQGVSSQKTEFFTDIYN
jgi:hypothetical protein